MKLIKILNNITVVLNNGDIISSDNCTEEMFKDIFNNQNDEEYIKNILIPEFSNKKKKAEVIENIINGFKTSKILTFENDKLYLKSISNLSLPQDLALKIYDAECTNNEELLQTYLNFWTLVSLNPDSECRKNLFWFLEKYGITISKSGLFIAYRNVDVKKEGSNIGNKLANIISSEYTRIKFTNKKSPKNYGLFKKEDDSFVTYKLDSSSVEGTLLGVLSDLYTELANVEVSTIYTDCHTRTFNIKLGEIVSMPRNQCDSDQNATCSRGLHVAGKSWLQKNYFGDVGLRVLVNPADVVAVPPQDSYGKMRVCAYYPVNAIQYGEDGQIADTPIEDGFEDDFMNKICYTGNFDNLDEQPYNIENVIIPEIDKSKINNILLEKASKINKIV